MFHCGMELPFHYLMRAVLNSLQFSEIQGNIGTEGATLKRLRQAVFRIRENNSRIDALHRHELKISRTPLVYRI